MQHYSVNIEARGDDDDLPVNLDVICTFSDTLEADPRVGSAVVSGGGPAPTYGARLDIEAPSITDAAAIGTSVFADSAAAVDLPAWPIIVIEVCDYDELDRRLDQPLIPELLSLSDVLTRLGVDTLPDGFPAPIATTADTDLWVSSTVRAWEERTATE